MTITAAADAQTGAMVAFVPASEWADRAAHPDGEPPEQLHMTAAYLGEAADWSPDQVDQIVTAVRQAAAEIGPVEAEGFALSIFNPMSDNPAIVLGISGAAVARAQARVAAALAPFGDCMPEQHAPHVPHVTLHYADRDQFADYMDTYAKRCGPMTFDRLRVAFAGEFVDIPIGDQADPNVNDPDVPEPDDTGSSMIAADTPAPAGGDAMQPAPVDMLIAPAAPPLATGGTPVEGVIAPEGIWSGDRRMFAPMSLTWAPLPLSLKWQPAEDEGHEGSVIVGRIDEIYRDGMLIRFRGVMDDGPETGGEMGCEAVRLMQNGMLRLGSLCNDDTDAIDIEEIYPQPVVQVVTEVPVTPPAMPTPAGQAPAADMAPPEMPEVVGEYGDPGEPAYIIHAGRIRSFTLVVEAAFIESTVSLMPQAVPADVTMNVVTTIPLTAAGHTITIPDVPPAEWFDMPTDVVLETALTVTDEGRIFGLLAPGSTGHRAFRNRRLTAPMGNVDYSRWRGRQTIVAGGGRVRTGVITMDCGHYPPQASADPAVRMQHYDNSCSVIADINIGECAEGVWVAGALKHYATAEQVSKLSSCVLSGDWAPHPDKPGTTEFVAALLVPVPGFATGEATVLTASMRHNESDGRTFARVPVVVAGGGWCAPPTNIYSLSALAEFATRDRLRRLEQLRVRVQGRG